MTSDAARPEPAAEPTNTVITTASGSSGGNVLQILPFEILVGEIFSTLPLTDLAQLTRVCKTMHELCQSDYLWQRKFFNDFASRPTKTLRQLGGWKRIYQAMDRVEVYTWGHNSDCRLGYGRSSKCIYESVPKRVRRLDGVGIVQLAPTGWGSHALDKHGNVWAWGRIMESNGIRSDAMPCMLKRPTNVVQLTSGRQVLLAKDENGKIWQWCRENKAVEVTFAPLRSSNITLASDHTPTSPPAIDPVEQISAGWDICAALTRSGRLFAWRPPQSADGRYQHRIHVEYAVSLKEHGGYAGYEASVIDGDKFVQIAAGTDYVVAVSSLERVYIFRRLDSPHYHDPTTMSTTFNNQYQYQPLPRFAAQQPQQHQREEELVDRILIETGIEGLMQERVVEMRGRILGEGLYLPIFSEALPHTITATYEEHDQWERRQRLHRRQISPYHHYRSQHHSQTERVSYPRQHLIRESCPGRHYSPTKLNPSIQDHNHYSGGDDTRSLDTDFDSPLTSPSSSHPTTITANFEQFALHHSSGKVLLGSADVQADTCPIVIDRLYSNVCQVAFGDHHQGLLTEDGQLRTWGAFSDGALGQGDLRNICTVPTVIEGPLKNKIVVAIGMAGWQSACLAIDMSDEKAPFCSSGNSSEALVSSPGAHLLGKGKLKDVLIDDGYHSLGRSSGRSNGDGSSTEGFDSSDGEEWTLRDNAMGEISNFFSQDAAASASAPALAPALSTSAPSSSSWASPPADRPHLSSACTATCSLLVSHSHYPGSGYGRSDNGSSANPRPTPLRRRSSSLTAGSSSNNGSSSSGISSNSRREYHYHSYSGGSSNKEEYKARLMALTRLSPSLTVYEPVGMAADDTTRRLSRL
ncbi:hypothetical protein BGZ98_006812 [Dissophora globulifera]|nr:hypothetical protein BGZ98_006812 [Dissophora globulifera]